MTLRESITNFIIKRGIKAQETEDEMGELFKAWALDLVGDYSYPIDKLDKKTEHDRITNLLNENMNIGYDYAITGIKQRIKEATK